MAYKTLTFRGKEKVPGVVGWGLMVPEEFLAEYGGRFAVVLTDGTLDPVDEPPPDDDVMWIPERGDTLYRVREYRDVTGPLDVYYILERADGEQVYVGCYHDPWRRSVLYWYQPGEIPDDILEEEEVN